jgi:hypothetical protein
LSVGSACPPGKTCGTVGESTPEGSCLPGTYNTGGTTTCTPCPAGSYCADPSQAPKPCLTGTFSTAGAAQCTPCPTGTISTTQGQTSCSYCPPGQTSLLSYSNGFLGGGYQTYSCTPCSAGTYCAGPPPGAGGSYTTGSQPPLPIQTCPAGTYCPVGSVAPTPCEIGKYCPIPGLAAGSACPPGQVCGSTGEITPDSACPAGYRCYQGNTIACNPGTYSEAGATTCSSCPIGTYSLSTAPACTPCPIGTYSSGTGSPTCTYAAA